MNTTTPIRAVLADDERLMREQLRSRLTEVWPELDIVAEAKNGLEAVELTREHKPDLVFLDIRMPGLTGVDAARQIAQLPEDDDWLVPEIVFITAYDQYAVEAFEQGVADYVLKPAERERLAVTVTRAGELRAQDMTAKLQAKLGGVPVANAIAEVGGVVREILVKNEEPVEYGQALGLDNAWAYEVLRQVGNYGELWERHITPMGIERGRNALWTKGGLQFAPPMR